MWIIGLQLKCNETQVVLHNKKSKNIDCKKNLLLKQAKRVTKTKI